MRNTCLDNFNVTTICDQSLLWPHLNSCKEPLQFFLAYYLASLLLWCSSEWKLQKFFSEKKMYISKWNLWKVRRSDSFGPRKPDRSLCKMPSKELRCWFSQQLLCYFIMLLHSQPRFQMNSFTINFIQRLALDHG